MRLALYISLTTLVCISGNQAMVYGQQPGINQVREKLASLESGDGFKKDTAYINTLNQLAYYFADVYPDSALSLFPEIRSLSKSVDYKAGEAEAYKIIGNAYQTMGNMDSALSYYEFSYNLARKNKLQKAIPGILNNIGLIYLHQGNYQAALEKFYETLKAAATVNDRFVTTSTLNNIAIVHFYQGHFDEAEQDYQETLKMAKESKDTLNIIVSYNNIGETNLEQNRPLDALQNLRLANQLALVKKNPDLLSLTTRTLGIIYFKLDSIPQAINHLDTAILLSKQQSNSIATCKALVWLAKVYYKQGDMETSKITGLEGLELAEEMGHTQLQRDAAEILSKIYESTGDPTTALGYYKNFKLFSDSLNNMASKQAAEAYKTNYEFSKKEAVFEKRSLQQKWLIFSAFAAALTLGIILWIINRNKKRLNHAFHTLKQKNILIESQKAKAEDALDKLKAAQSQLIHSEKMASLGELTAGIAHEIQNPLNFVNNFSEVNAELTQEIRDALSKGKLEEVKQLAEDLQANHEKIREHGKRAEGIVKSMLEHSRTNSGQKEFTDLNDMVSQYLRLSFHGMRARDKTFNAQIESVLDEGIPKMEINQQDMGRVLLNLFNNAFYAVQERSGQEGESYIPKVKVTTKLGNRKVEIHIVDNGTGISDSIREKIFQPFFTTKPSGQGTGLGLSISYDIIKSHGGSMTVESIEKESTEFILELPI